MEAERQTSPSSEQIDPSGDMLHIDDSGDVVEPGGLIPPYEGRTTGRDDDTPEGDKARPAESAGKSNTDGPGSEEAPEGVGETSPGTARGENQVAEKGKEAGRHDEGTEGGTDRPVGSSDKRDMTGI